MGQLCACEPARRCDEPDDGASGGSAPGYGAYPAPPNANGPSTPEPLVPQPPVASEGAKPRSRSESELRLVPQKVTAADLEAGLRKGELLLAALASLGAKAARVDGVGCFERLETELGAAKTQHTADLASVAMTIGQAISDASKYLVEIVDQGDVKALRTLLDGGADIEADSLEHQGKAYSGGKSRNSAAGAQRGFRAAHVAAWKGNTECLQILVDRRCDLEAGDGVGNTPLSVSASFGRQGCLDLLIGAKANLEARNKYGPTPTIVAATSGHDACLQALCHAKANIDARRDPTGKSGNNALLCAALFGYPDCVRTALRARADPSVKTSSGHQAAHLAARHGQKECLTALFDVGVSVEVRTQDGRTVAHIAASSGHGECVRELIRIGADMHAISERSDYKQVEDAASPGPHRPPGGASVFLSCLFGGVLVRRLYGQVSPRPLDHKKAKEINFSGVASKEDSRLRVQELFRKLRKEGYPGGVDAKDPGGETFAHYATKRGFPDSLLNALELGADPEQRTPGGQTVALLAAEKKQEDCLKVLAHGWTVQDQESDRFGGFFRANLEAQASDDRHVLEIADSVGIRVEYVADPAPWLKLAAEVPVLTQSKVEELLAKPHGTATLRLALHGHNVGIDGEKLGVRRRQQVELQRKMVALCAELIDQVGNQIATGREVLTSLVTAGVIRNLDRQTHDEFEQRTRAALGKLELVLAKRQQDALGPVMRYTDTVDTYTPHKSRDGKTVHKLDQRDALPKLLWAWTEHGGPWSDKGRDGAIEGFALAQEAFHAATLDPTKASEYIREQFARDSELFAHGAMHIMALYAERVDAEFKAFMTEMFPPGSGKAPDWHVWAGGPVKRTKRMYVKIREDLMHSGVQEASSPQRVSVVNSLDAEGDSGSELAAMWGDTDRAAADHSFRSLPYSLADLVRGSVYADGAHAMIAAAQKLRQAPYAEDSIGRRFEAWRVKNTHHPDAKVVGGYRDIKVIGKFTSKIREEHVSILAEVQIVDRVFKNVKDHMHKPFTIVRGDYWDTGTS